MPKEKHLHWWGWITLGNKTNRHSWLCEQGSIMLRWFWQCFPSPVLEYSPQYIFLLGVLEDRSWDILAYGRSYSGETVTSKYMNLNSDSTSLFHVNSSTKLLHSITLLLWRKKRGSCYLLYSIYRNYHAIGLGPCCFSTQLWLHW